MPCFRRISATGMPASPSFNTATICDSLKRDFFIGDASRKAPRIVYLMLPTRQGSLPRQCYAGASPWRHMRALIGGPAMTADRACAALLGFLGPTWISLVIAPRQYSSDTRPCYAAAMLQAPFPLSDPICYQFAPTTARYVPASGARVLLGRACVPTQLPSVGIPTAACSASRTSAASSRALQFASP